MEILVVAASLVWVAILLAPWCPWGTSERLESGADGLEDNFCDLTVMIPARNEAVVIERTLIALRSQGKGFSTILIDDQSSDGTVGLAQRSLIPGMMVVKGSPLPAGWTGKLWAMEQGWRHVKTEFLLLLDADIELKPGMLTALRGKMEGLDLVSIMAELRMQTFWERMLVPAFVYFFKLIYPFRLGNDPCRRLGVAAGGCMLLRCAALRTIGGFEPLRTAIIDDCRLARKIKEAGGRTWTGLSRSVRSHRAYERLSDFWEMVARTAFTQLRYSIWLLFGTTFAMLLSFWIPLIGLWMSPAVFKGVSMVGLTGMIVSYLPILGYYRRSLFWVLALPIISVIYLLMTWSSAIRYWHGKRSVWKGRVY